MIRALAVSLIAVLSASASVRSQESANISPATKDASGVLVHEVRSPYQAKPTLIRVLQPEKPGRYPVVYLLPVEAGVENRYGDALKEIQKHDLHNRLGAVFVSPTFAHLPWYADHPSKREIRQESDFVKVLVPFIEKTYPVLAESRGRFLLGFSKSGWGAWSLLLRHPDRFHKAAAWDAPLMMNAPGKYGSGEIFGTADNFRSYEISQLLRDRADMLRQEKRLILHGYGNFRSEHERTHALLNELKIPHEYRDGPARKHDWHSGWVADAATALLGKP